VTPRDAAPAADAWPEVRTKAGRDLLRSWTDPDAEQLAARSQWTRDWLALRIPAIEAEAARPAAEPLTVEALAKALHEAHVDCSRFAGSVVVSPSGASPLDRVVLTCQPGHHMRAAAAILAALARQDGGEP
jgi:hypothetical protein